MDTVKVFKLDGSLQCGMGKEVTLEDMAEKIRMIGGEITYQEKKVVPYMIPEVCGAPTGSANVYTITKESWENIKKSFVGTLGFKIWVFDTPTVFVYKYDGSLQCGMGKEVPLEEMAKELESNNIAIHSQYKSNDGAFRITMCGASTGDINVYEIDADAFPMAKKLGFVYLMNKEMVSAMMESGAANNNFVLTNNLTAEMRGEDPPFPWRELKREDPPLPW